MSYKPGRKPRQCTSKERFFIYAWLRLGNATKAAIESGSPVRNAANCGCEMLKRPHVKQLIAELTKAADRQAVLDAARVLKEIERIALMDPADAFDKDGHSLLNIHDIPEDARRCISGIDVEELWEGRGQDREQVGVVKKVRFWSKPDSLNMLAKYLRMWVEAQQPGGRGTGGPQIDLAWADEVTLRKLAEGK